MSHGFKWDKNLTNILSLVDSGANFGLTKAAACCGWVAIGKVNLMVCTSDVQSHKSEGGTIPLKSYSVCLKHVTPTQREKSISWPACTVTYLVKLGTWHCSKLRYLRRRLVTHGHMGIPEWGLADSGKPALPPDPMYQFATVNHLSTLSLNGRLRISRATIRNTA